MKHRMNTMTIKRKCKTCGQPFAIAQGEAIWYKEKGLELPTNCAECRKAKKEGK